MLRLIFLLTAISSLCSCHSYNYLAFSNQVIKEYNLEASSIQDLQFYTSGEIILYSKASYGSKGLEDGRLRKDSQSELDEFVIPRYTPGVVRSITKKGQLAVNFDTKNPDCVLMFGVHPNRNDQYVLLAEKWKDGRGTVPFCGKDYLFTAASRNVHLLVDERATRKTKRQTKVARGATIR